MKTVITKVIDGYTVVVGLDRPLIDAQATKKQIEGMIEETDEYKAVTKKSEEMQRLSGARNALVLEGREAFSNGDNSRIAKVKYEIELRDEQIKQVQAQLSDLVNDRNKKYSAIFASNAVYFTPKAGEEIITDEKANDIVGKINALGKNQVLCRDGKVIDDLRGVRYVKNGKVKQVTKLGEKPDGPLAEDVTPEEFEDMRIDALSDKERAAELERLKDGLASQAAAKKAKLDIQQVENALEVSIAWYDGEVAKAEKKYKIKK